MINVAYVGRHHPSKVEIITRNRQCVANFPGLGYEYNLFFVSD